MKAWLKDQWPTFLAIALMVIILVIIFRRQTDNGTAVTKFQIDELKKENDLLRTERDSLIKTVAPVIIPNDSLQQVAIELNRKTLYEIRKKNADGIDTVSGEELRNIFSEYRRQYDLSTH